MPSLRFLPALAALLVLWAASPLPAAAQSAGDAFTVRGVDVDVTAGNPQAAKDQAIAEGQNRAFRLLLERLTQPADHNRLPKADGTQYVRDFSVEQERTLATRYIATLTVRFNPAAVRKLLQGAGIAYAEPRNRVLVVVPVFKPVNGKPVLWDDPNPWRAAWNGLGGGGLVPVVVPTGDLTDLQAITTEQAMAGNPDAMQAVGARWRTTDVLVAVAGFAPDGKVLDVSLMGSPGAPKPFDSIAYKLNEGESTDALLARAVRDIDRGIDTVFKQPNLLSFDRTGTLSAMVPLSGIEDWLAVRERLSKVSQVRRWELVSLSKAEAALVLHVVGDDEQVKAALANQGLRMDWGDGYWVMRPPGARK
ncbi:MAG TPA: DUF2066 domain-containing protein [Magnetospirillum sp.]|jgi:hypothetical protein|nr:DUF2066 domain-containing protein [Magnetospirillum sp.]